jgi:hypothetical protein
MIKALPDKYIRKAVFDAINNIVVDTKTIPCFDMRVTGANKSNYVLMQGQSSIVDKTNKCADMWESQILLEIFTSYNLSGNTGSRLLSDNILDKVRELTDDLTLDVASGLTIQTQTQSFPNDLDTTTGTKIVFRKFIRIEFLIN